MDSNPVGDYLTSLPEQKRRELLKQDANLEAVHAHARMIADAIAGSGFGPQATRVIGTTEHEGHAVGERVPRAGGAAVREWCRNSSLDSVLMRRRVSTRIDRCWTF